MACQIAYHTSRAKRKCRICGDFIVEQTWAVEFSRLPAGGSWHSYHFHEGCLSRALQSAKDAWGKVE